MYNYIQENITGRIAITEGEAALLSSLLKPNDTYLEIGCLWGGTAILAALNCQRVITVDFMKGGFWNTEDPISKLRPTPEIVLDNFVKFNVAHKISIVRDYSYPWKIDIYPDVMLVDGGHGYEAASRDWNTASKITKRTILVHDYDDKHRDVTRMVSEIDLAEWEAVARVESMVYFKRRNA